MTAIVGFMNKRGVAVAADSAVTLGNTHKVVNSGNKIFTLSKHAPVGIATYGNTAFMDTPWEIIIKLYRKHLGRNKFDTLNQYIMSFIEYLHEENFFVSEEYQKRILHQRAIFFYNKSVENSQQLSGYKKSLASDYLVQELNRCKQVNAKDVLYPSMESYSYKNFHDYFQDIFFSNIVSMPLLATAHIQAVFLESFYQYLVACVPYASDSGLVFFGYGEKEIYPSMVNIIVADSFDHNLRNLRIEGNSGTVTAEGSTAWVIPYAQVDVAQTIIRGINPSFLDILKGTLLSVLDGYRQTIQAQLPQNTDNANAIRTILAINNEDIAQQFVNNAANQFKMYYTDPLVNTIASLSKEDMANLAKSLVELTSLVRRMSPSEETVGGPIDVAVVSKGDGFIWLKRKHYFDPQLNPNFINTYNDD